MAVSKDIVFEALSNVQDPDLRRDLVTIGAVKKVAVCDGFVTVEVGLPGGAEADFDALRSQMKRAIADRIRESGEPEQRITIEFLDRKGNIINADAPAKGGVGSVAPERRASEGGGPQASDRTSPQGGGAQRQGPQGEASAMPGVSRIIAVGAGKGGVGKSTVAVNLAVALARKGHAVGLMDGDIYGPSVPTLMGLEAMDPVVRGNLIEPFLVHGVKTMTIGKLVEKEKPLIWRGPMAHGAFKQIAEQTNWGELDYLIIDLPPGTGDVVLTMSQIMRLDGGVIVCTPQKVAQDDAVRAAGMFEKLGVDVVGVVENMSSFIGDDGKEYDIFGRGGAQQMAQRLGLPFLGAIPITMALRENSDAGDPTANFEDDPNVGEALTALSDQLENQVNLAAMKRGSTGPTLTIS